MKKILLLLLIILSLDAFAQHPCSPPIITVSGATWKCKGIRDTLFVSGPNGTTYVWDNGKTTTSYITGPIDGDSTFYVIGTNGGCSDTAYFIVALRTAPTVTLNPPAFTCDNEPVVLSANASGMGTFSYIWEPGGGTTTTITVMDSIATTYTLTVSNGCETVKITTVTPDYPAMAACCNVGIQPGHDTIITASGSNIVSYQWSPSVTCLNPLCDSVKVSPTVTTTYTVTGTDSIGCQALRVVTIYVGPAAVPSISAIDFINVYPNPTSTAFTATLKTKAEIKVCDITGRLLYSNMENAGTFSFGKELNPGMYFLFINGKPEAKLVKE